jgi:hypothetical protein
VLDLVYLNLATSIIRNSNQKKEKALAPLWGHTQSKETFSLFWKIG